jgi:uncharacterized protein (TIGR03083 family)
MTMRRADVAEAIALERSELVRDLAALDAAHWDEPSLCAGWNVRDVVGHLVYLDRAYAHPSRFGLDTIRHGVSLNRALARTARAYAAGRTNSELTDAISSARWEKRFAFRAHPAPAMMLGEVVIHGQDVRRPLGLQHAFPADILGAVADVLLRRSYPWGRTHRVTGVRMEASDADWSTGRGPVVGGPLEAIVMVLAGRTSAVSDLDGDGVALLHAADRS